MHGLLSASDVEYITPERLAAYCLKSTAAKIENIDRDHIHSFYGEWIGLYRQGGSIKA